MTKQNMIAVRPDDHEKFKQLAFRKKKKLVALFHEMIEEEMKNEVV